MDELNAFVLFSSPEILGAKPKTAGGRLRSPSWASVLLPLATGHPPLVPLDALNLITQHMAMRGMLLLACPTAQTAPK
jgi:hypothetical protein